jgi:hypothetical protein
MHHRPCQRSELQWAVLSGFVSRRRSARKVFRRERESIFDPNFRLDAKEAEIAEIDAEGRGFGDGDFGWVRGGSDHDFFLKLSRHPLLSIRMGGSCTRVDRPVQEPGAHECAPHTAAIAHQPMHDLLVYSGVAFPRIRSVKTGRRIATRKRVCPVPERRNASGRIATKFRSVLQDRVWFCGRMFPTQGVGGK